MAKKTTIPKMEVYSVKEKKKVTVKKGTATITKTKRNSFMLRGLSAKGDKLTGLVSKANAALWIKEGLAKKDYED